MRLKLNISVPHGNELREVFMIPQSAHTMGEVLASVVDEFGLQNGEVVAAYTLDGYHLGANLEAWRCLEKDMVVKVRQVGVGAGKQLKQRCEEANGVKVQSEQEAEKTVEVSEKGEEVGTGSDSRREEEEEEEKGGAEEAQSWNPPAPRREGEVETRSCSECPMRGSIEAFGLTQWWNPMRCCGSCWGRKRRRESEAKKRAPMAEAKKERAEEEAQVEKEKERRLAQEAWYEQISQEEEDEEFRRRREEQWAMEEERGRIMERKERKKPFKKERKREANEKKKSEGREEGHKEGSEAEEEDASSEGESEELDEENEEEEEEEPEREDGGEKGEREIEEEVSRELRDERVSAGTWVTSYWQLYKWQLYKWQLYGIPWKFFFAFFRMPHHKTHHQPHHFFFFFV